MRRLFSWLFRTKLTPFCGSHPDIPIDRVLNGFSQDEFTNVLSAVSTNERNKSLFSFRSETSGIRQTT